MADTPITPSPATAGLALPATPPQVPAGTPQTPPVTPVGELPKPAETPAAPETPAVLPTALDLVKLQKEIDSTGALSEESAKDLKARGITDAMISEYVEGRQAVISQTRASIVNEAGGEEGYKQVTAWATSPDGLSAAEQTQFNKIVAGGDPAAIRLAVRGLAARYTTKFGNSPQLVSGQGPAKPQIFTSQREYVEAIKNVRYGKDIEFTRNIDARLKATIESRR